MFLITLLESLLRTCPWFRNPSMHVYVIATGYDVEIAQLEGIVESMSAKVVDLQTEVWELAGCRRQHSPSLDDAQHLNDT